VFGCSGVIFLLTEFPFHQQNICLILFRILIFFCTHFCTHLFILEVIYFSAYNATLSYEFEEEEAPEQEKFLAFMAPHVEEEDAFRAQ
jgi:hypothetical protein